MYVRNLHVQQYLDDMVGDQILFDFNIASRLLGMRKRDLVDYFRTRPQLTAVKNKWNQRKFITARTFRQIRDDILEQVPIIGDYDRRARNLPSVRRKLARLGLERGEDHAGGIGEGDPDGLRRAPEAVISDEEGSEGD